MNVLLFIGIFVLAFFYEVAIVLYTQAVSDRRPGQATVMTVLCGVFSFIGITSYINKPILIIPFIMGEALATYLVVRYNK